MLGYFHVWLHKQRSIHPKGKTKNYKIRLKTKQKSILECNYPVPYPLQFFLFVFQINLRVNFDWLFLIVKKNLIYFFFYKSLWETLELRFSPDKSIFAYYFVIQWSPSVVTKGHSALGESGEVQSAWAGRWASLFCSCGAGVRTAFAPGPSSLCLLMDPCVSEKLRKPQPLYVTRVMLYTWKTLNT